MLFGAETLRMHQRTETTACHRPSPPGKRRKARRWIGSFAMVPEPHSMTLSLMPVVGDSLFLSGFQTRFRIARKAAQWGVLLLGG